MCCGGGSSAPAAPDYSSITGPALATAATDQAQSQQQLAWSKDQWAAQQPITNAYMTQMVANQTAQSGQAALDTQRYNATYAPLEDQFAATAAGYNSPARAAANSGAATADVAAQFDAQRKTALSSLESYGIDPSQTRFGALDLGTRVSQAAASAAAGTGSRLQTEQTGLQLQQAAIGIGQKLPGAADTAYSGAASSGAAAVNAGNATSNTYGNLMGTASQWAGSATQSLGAASGAINQGYQNQAQSAKINADAEANESSGIGSMIGAGVGIAAIAI